MLRSFFIVNGISPIEEGVFMKSSRVYLYVFCHLIIIPVSSYSLTRWQDCSRAIRLFPRSLACLMSLYASVIAGH